MTDNEIVKALECCSTASCISNKCHYEKLHDIPTCTTKLTKDALDLINRLQVENEDIKFLYENLKEEHLEIIKAIKRTKTEAYKECIEKVKAEINKHSYGVLHKTVINFKLDNILKELVGDNQ